jgi:hypothetical protein
MALKLKENKKVGRKKSPKKEVEIPVFVISKKETVGFKKHFSEFEELREADNFRIARDKDDLPVLEKLVSVSDSGAEEKTHGENIQDEWKEIKNQTHQKSLSVSTAEKKEKRSAPLSEKNKRAILWVSVTVIACLVFFVWLYNLKNSFSGIFGSASYTFSRSAGALQEVSSSFGQFQNQLSNLKNAVENQSAAGTDQGVVDQIKEKILVEELKDKLAK